MKNLQTLLRFEKPFTSVLVFIRYVSTESKLSVENFNELPKDQGLTEQRPISSILDCSYYKKLPESYRKFYREWKLTVPEPVHYIPKEGKYEIDAETGQVIPIKNIAITLSECPQEDSGIWGGEAVIQGYVRILKGKHRVHDLGPTPMFWYPKFRRTVIYSEILDKNMVAVVTRRAILKINENYGLDHYLLKTRACDLRNLLALKLKRKLLQALLNRSLYPDDENKREDVYNTYKHYLEPYSPEDIEWYGLTLEEASTKMKGINLRIREESNVPLKYQFRKDYIELLKNEKVVEPPEPWYKRKLLPF